jgi:ribosome-binding factor A
MKSQRQLQIGENIKRIMSEIFLQEDFSVIMNNVITIIEADVSPDAKNVKIFIDILGDSSKHKQIIDKIYAFTPHFRYELAKKINLRIIPEITFIHDKTFQNATTIEAIISKEAQYFLDPKNSQKNNKNEVKKSRKSKDNSSEIKKKSVRKKS